MPSSRPEKIDSLVSDCVITSKLSGHTYLCQLIHVAEREKRTMGKRTEFTEEERDKLYNNALQNLLRTKKLVPDFYLERWPDNSKKDPSSVMIYPPFVHLRIEFYQALEPITVHQLF